RATLERKVSTEIMQSGNPADSWLMNGARRSISSCSLTSLAFGREEYAPISMISAPSASICSACRSAAENSVYLPPSENEAGVTFRIPIIRGWLSTRILSDHRIVLDCDVNTRFDILCIRQVKYITVIL